MCWKSPHKICGSLFNHQTETDFVVYHIITSYQRKRPCHICLLLHWQFGSGVAVGTFDKCLHTYTYFCRATENVFTRTRIQGRFSWWFPLFCDVPAKKNLRSWRFSSIILGFRDEEMIFSRTQTRERLLGAVALVPIIPCCNKTTSVLVLFFCHAQFPNCRNCLHNGTRNPAASLNDDFVILLILILPTER